MTSCNNDRTPETTNAPSRRTAAIAIGLALLMGGLFVAGGVAATGTAFVGDIDLPDEWVDGQGVYNCIRTSEEWPYVWIDPDQCA